MDPVSSNIQKLAIDAALSSHWEEALKLNKKIIRVDPQNVDALNRQGRCYMELGKLNLAKKYYGAVLKLDPYNPIALKILKILKTQKSLPNLPSDGQMKVVPQLFLQEPGKTKVVTLSKVAEPKTLYTICCGMQVNMVVKNKKIVVERGGDYLGVLPDDICHHLLRLIKGGNKYDLYVKSIKVNSISVLIRETFRSKRFKNQPSFLEGSQNLISDVITPLNQGAEAPEADGEEEAEET